MSRTTYFAEYVAALDAHAVRVELDDETEYDAWWPVEVQLPTSPALHDGRIHVEFGGQTEDVDGRTCSHFWAVDEAEGERLRRAAGVEDFFETHEQDDLKDFGDNEAWADMQGEFDE